MKLVPFFSGRYAKGIPFLPKMVKYKRVSGWSSGWHIPVQDFVEWPPGRKVNYFSEYAAHI